MTTAKIEELDQNRVKLTITVPHEEVQPFLEEAAAQISQDTKIDGFRPGKASYEAVKQRVGEMKIYEAALETIVRKTFVKTVLEHEIDTVGSPHLDIEKMAPGNDLVYTAEVARMPKITQIADYKKLSVASKPVTVEQKDVDLALQDLTRMQTKEVRGKSDETIGENDKVIVSMDMKQDGVAVEGGQSPNHAIFMAEDYYVPGLKDKLLGKKEGDKLTFTLPFPEDHIQKMLAGKEIEFSVEVKELYHLEAPELNDAFAQSLGQKDYKSLEALLNENLKKEKEEEEAFRVEKEMLELVAEKTRFETLPDLLVNEEVNKMVHELEHRVQQQGLDFDKYLESIKKSIADLKMEFTPQAMMRIKVALVIKEIAKVEKIEADSKTVDEELDKLAAQYEDKETKNKIFSPQYREYMEGMQRNRAVIDFLKETMIK